MNDNCINASKTTKLRHAHKLEMPRCPMPERPALLLDAAAVAELLDYPSCIDAIEAAFRRHGERADPAPDLCSVHVEGGGFHVKAAALDTGRSYFAAKANANFPANPELHGLPTIQGVLLLFDATRGTLLAAMDSGAVTLRRTAAATAVAARWLARADSAVATLCGCGVQGRAQLLALSRVLPLRRVFAYDRSEQVAARFGADMSVALGLEVTAVPELARYTRISDVCVTCTPSHAFVLGADDVRPGTFVAGVGADHPDKRELQPDLLARATLVVDVLEQCATIGDLHHALLAGWNADDLVHAELGEVVAGLRPGRESSDELTVFDSTGSAFQDVAAGALVYERALQRGRGGSFAFSGGGEPRASRAATSTGAPRSGAER
jgi:ornithine cyclodeaminase/alanine dehydrogenase-like protein (mu-crystallin family)